MKIALLIPDNRDEFKDYSAPLPRFGPAPTALLEGLAQLPECEVHVVACVHQAMAAPAKIAPNIWYHSVVVPRWGWRVAFAGCVWAIRKMLSAIGPDIVHAQGTERYCAIAGALCGFPNVITVHGNMRAVSKAMNAPVFSPQRLAGFLERIALARTNGVICLTSYARRQAGEVPGPTWIVPNGVDMTFFEARRLPDPVTTILCPADAAVYKNQVRLIQALDQTARERTIRLILAGKISPDTAYGAELLRFCAERQWCEHVGNLDREGMKQLLSRTTIVVLPSLEDNCPMVVLEAMAAGVPVAASNIGGIPDLIESGVTGLLFNPKDERSIRAAIEELLNDPEQASRMSRTGQELARTRFAPLRIAERHLEIYDEVLSRISPRDRIKSTSSESRASAHQVD